MLGIYNLRVRSGEFAMAGINLEVPGGNYGVLMGRTGCGKTTLLEAICGLKKVEEGSIVIGERAITLERPGERGIGYLPQDVALFRHMTVREHLEFGPRVARWDSSVTAKQVKSLARELGIDGLLDRRPRGLSGGEQQRVALGRALSVRPSVLLLDEPLSALDDETHEEICQLLKRVQAEHRLTVLHVTHSRREAERLSDCLFFFEEGAIERSE